MKSIINKNDKGQWHGYQEWYFDGKLYFKGFWYNGIRVNYDEHYLIGNLMFKTFHI